MSVWLTVRCVLLWGCRVDEMDGPHTHTDNTPQIYPLPLLKPDLDDGVELRNNRLHALQLVLREREELVQRREELDKLQHPRREQL